MRTSLLFAVWFGCGRLDFDQVPLRADAGQPDGTTLDGQQAAVAATEITGITLSLAIPASMVSVARLPGGAYAVGWIGAPPSPVSGFIVSVAGSASVVAPGQLTPTIGSPYGYKSMSLSVTAGVITGAVEVTDGTSYLKTYQSDMSTFSSANARTGSISRPGFATAGTTNLAVFTTGGLLTAVGIGNDGLPLGSDVSLGVSSTGRASVASIGGSIRVFAETTTNACAVFSVSPTFLTDTPTIINGCARPSIASRRDDDAVLAFTSGTNVVGGLLSGGTRFVANGADPRASYNATSSCITWVDGGIHVARVSGTGADSQAIVTGLPARDPDAYDVDGDTAFALYGHRLFRFPACF